MRIIIEVHDTATLNRIGELSEFLDYTRRKLYPDVIKGIDKDII